MIYPLGEKGHPMPRPTPVLRNARIPALLLLAAFLLLAACSDRWDMDGHHAAMHSGTDSRSDSLVEASDTAAVTIQDSSFRPGNLRVTAGTSVTWTNRDGVPHTATSTDGSWDTGLLSQRESGTITFDEPGVYEYSCLPHPNMKARIEVVAS